MRRMQLICDGKCKSCGLDEWCSAQYGADLCARQEGVISWLRTQRDSALQEIPREEQVRIMRKMDEYVRAETAGDTKRAEHIMAEMNCGEINARWLLSIHKTLTHYLR